MSSGISVITYDQGRVFVSLPPTTGTLKDARRQLSLLESQRFSCNGRQVSRRDEARPVAEWLLTEIPAQDFFSSSSTTSSAAATSSGRRYFEHTTKNFSSFSAAAAAPSSYQQTGVLEVSPRDFFIPQDKYAFAGLTTSQRTFGCAATSVRVILKKQLDSVVVVDAATTTTTNNSNATTTTTPVLRFSIISRIENWTGKSIPAAQACADDVDFAVAATREVALLLAARGTSDVCQLQSIYFGGNQSCDNSFAFAAGGNDDAVVVDRIRRMATDQHQKDLYLVVDEGPVEKTVDIATFVSTILNNNGNNDDGDGGEKVEGVAGLAVDAARQILDGVAHLHELGVVHGGISPRSVLASKVIHPVSGITFWKFFLRDLGLIESAALKYRKSGGRLCFRNDPTSSCVKKQKTSSSSTYYSWSSGSPRTPSTSDVVASSSSNNNSGKENPAQQQQRHLEPFFSDSRYTDEDLSLRYASPESIVGAPATQASDVWSIGVILAEMFGSLSRKRLEPLLEECGVGALRRTSSSSKTSGGVTIDKEDIWDRVTAGAGFPVSWAEARRRYAETAHNKNIDLSSSLRSQHYAPSGKPTTSQSVNQTRIGWTRSSDTTTASLANSLLVGEQPQQQQQQEKKDAGSSSSVMTTIARTLCVTPSNPYGNKRATGSSSSSSSMVSGGTAETTKASAVALTTAFASTETNSPERQRAEEYHSHLLSPHHRTPHRHQQLQEVGDDRAATVGDFSKYLSNRGVSPDLRQLLISMLHFYPERRPAAIRCRREACLYSSPTAANVSNQQKKISSTSVIARLHFAQKIDQSELHQAILATIDAVANREPAEEQQRRLTQVAQLVDGCVKRGSLRSVFGTLLQDILLSNPGMRKLKADKEHACREKQQQQNSGEDGNDDADADAPKHGSSEYLLFGGTSEGFSGVETLRTMMKLLLCLANSRDLS